MADKVKAVALKDFKDAGTEQVFSKGDNIELEQGVFENYLAGELVAKQGTNEGRAAKEEAKADPKLQA